MIYLICPVRNVTDEVQAKSMAYVRRLEARGETVHYPPRDVAQDDPTGENICAAHLAAMKEATEVHVYWDSESKGSHFDLGMAYALGKKIVSVDTVRFDPPGKSYWKVINAYQANPN